MMLLVFLLVLGVCCEVELVEPSSITIQYRVLEEQTSGTRVGCLVDDLRQRDVGGPFQDFQVVEHDKSLPFAVSTRDGVLSTQGRLDREELCRGSDLCEVAFSVLYRKGGAVNCLRIRVEVMDQNDHSPCFPSMVQEVEISESASVRMQIPLEGAVDPDAGPNSLQTYILSPNNHFVLDVTVAPGGTKQAELVVIKELDREIQDMVELTLVACDKGNPPRSGSTLIQVNVLDSNDNCPTFEDSMPTVEIPEDTPRGTTIINLKATDPDLGTNGEVVYSLSKHTRPEVQRFFNIDSQTGAVSLKAPLDYEVQATYEVIVEARDRGPNAIPTHCKLHVKLQDVNDNAPRITLIWTSNLAGATVLEGAPKDTFLALVMVSDADSGKNGKVSAEIQTGSGPFRLKHAEGSNYMIVTDGSLDREKVMKYNITLVAQDHGDPPLSCVKHLLVNILDENDNAPVFSTRLYKASFEENNVAGYHALKVEAKDVDLELSGRVSYHIRNFNEDDDSQYFSIHPTSGVISVQHPLDYEESNTYKFIVEAVDQGHPPLTSTALVQIDVKDVNDNYPVIKEPKPRNGRATLNVPVNTDRGEIVTELGYEELKGDLPPDHPVFEGFIGFHASTIKAEDADSGLSGQLRYLITHEDPERLFWLDESSGQLFVNTTNATGLIGKTFMLDIAVSDMGSPSLTAEAILEVTFINLRDHLKNSSPGTWGHLSFTMMMAICLGATCLLLLLAVALVTTFCRPEKRDGRAYNCRQAESTYTCHPRRPQKNIRKSDIQLIPVIRGRKEEPPEDEGDVQPLSQLLAMSEEKQQAERQYTLASSVLNTSFQSQSYVDGDVTTHTRTLCKPGNLELDNTLTSTTSYRTLRKARNPSSSSSSGSRTGTLKCQARADAEEPNTASSPGQATLRRPKTSEGHQDAEHRQMLRNLVRLSMAAFGDSIELSAASPEVQQISQLLSLLRQGQLQPRPNFRGNKYSHRNRYGGQDCSDWQSTKDSGHGESEAGDVDWEAGRDSPIDPQLDDGLLSKSDDVFSEEGDPSWLARLSLPLSGDYHDNVFTPSGPLSPESNFLPRDVLDSSSFSTFGKTPEKDGPLGGALLSEVSTLFEMLMTQKADAHPGPRADVLYRLSAAYRCSLGLDTATNAANTPRNPGTPERRSKVAPSTELYHQ